MCQEEREGRKTVPSPTPSLIPTARAPINKCGMFDGGSRMGWESDDRETDMYIIARPIDGCAHAVGREAAVWMRSFFSMV